MVKPLPDGVHLEFVNETGKELAYAIEDPSGASGIGSGVPRGGSAEVLDVHPGTVSVTVRRGLAGGPAAAPAPRWRSSTGTASGSRSSSPARRPSRCSRLRGGAKGEPDPLAVAQEAFELYTKPGDVVEPAGYPEAATRLYRLTRAGEVLATVDLLDDGAGGWLPDTVTGCSSLQD